MTCEQKPEQSLREGAVHLTNEAGTCAPGDAGLTQSRSADVPPGFTYFIHDGADAIKIGFSRYPKGRMIELQTSHHIDLTLLLSVPSSILTEAEGHAKFSHLRIRGEWFRAEPELLDFIEEMRIKMDARKQDIRRKNRPDPVVNDLRAKRLHYRSDQPAFQRISNLIEQLTNYRGTMSETQKRNLPLLIMESARDIRELTTI